MTRMYRAMGLLALYANHWNYYLFYLFIIVIVTYTYIHFRNNKEGLSEPEFKGRGYCDINAEYTEPVFYPDFITPEQSNKIKLLAEPEFTESTTVSGIDTDIRKSQTAWLSRDEPVVKNIIEQVCAITNLPFSHAEKMQVVKYGPNGYYNEHYDASCDNNKECVEFEKNGGQRKITMLIYLNDDFEGGETNFPTLKQTYKPQKNGGLLFYSLQNDGNQCHPKSLHAGVPVKSGNKYICNVWVRENPYHA
jgi:prolyl 4-hydroxylase